eukprot:Partr_v1_DN27241_c1_g1_i1_m38384 putative (dCMP) deaminase
MLIGLSGAVCSGKKTFAKWLHDQYQFTVISVKNDDDSKVHSMEFASLVLGVSDLDDYLLADGRWREKYVAIGIESSEDLIKLQKRPFFLHICVDAPILTRFNRFQVSSNGSPMDLHTFVATSLDSSLLLRSADIVLRNDYLSIDEFIEYCHRWYIKFNPEANLRPSWDDYFMLLADLASHRSNCMKRRVGCILVKSRRVIATGYNGTPRGTRNCCDGGCNRCNGGAKCGQQLTECLCLHAEENALLEAGRERIDSADPSDGVSLYCNTCPCLSCAKKIVQCGVRSVIYRQSYGMDSMTANLFTEAGISLRQHRPRFNLQIHVGDLLVDN